MVIVEEDAALEPPIQAKRACPACCCFSYRVPTLRELYSQDKRLLRAILLIVVLLNAPVGKYLLYPFMIFSTWIHELFHGLAALTVGGSITWLNIYPDGSGLAYTVIPVGVFQRAWVASAGYQSTAIIGGISLMFRRTNVGARIGTCGIGMLMLFTCILFVRNAFGLAMLVLMGLGLVVAGWCLPPFWIGELYALIAATTCLNAITSVRVLFFVTESNIGGVASTSDAMTMQNITKIHYYVWASIWMALALWMTTMGIFVNFETQQKQQSNDAVIEGFQDDRHPLTMTEMT
ncbi:hypothetical protein ACHAWT_010659 [Skeletonema menzelii]